MKATGIVRYIDDLGRVTIPKEVRRRYKFETGNAVEFFVEDDKIIIKKYLPQTEMTKKVGEIIGDMLNSFDPLNPMQVRALENLKELQELIIERES